mmetsp:Transcript_18966/g.27797  ORF Transcript_18966/g.27797 Transcript_18966/m.27797 type:complete len:249 (-) Transcript_18966:1487-2233(-)
MLFARNSSCLAKSFFTFPEYSFSFSVICRFSNFWSSSLDLAIPPRLSRSFLYLPNLSLNSLFFCSRELFSSFKVSCLTKSSFMFPEYSFSFSAICCVSNSWSSSFFLATSPSLSHSFLYWSNISLSSLFFCSRALFSSFRLQRVFVKLSIFDLYLAVFCRRMSSNSLIFFLYRDFLILDCSSLSLALVLFVATGFSPLGEILHAFRTPGCAESSLSILSWFCAFNSRWSIVCGPSLFFLGPWSCCLFY